MLFPRANAAETLYSSLMSKMLGLYASRRYEFVVLDCHGTVAGYPNKEEMDKNVGTAKSVVFWRDDKDKIIMTSLSGHKIDRDYNETQDKFEKFCASVATLENSALRLWVGDSDGDGFRGFLRGTASLRFLEANKIITSAARGYSKMGVPSLAIVTATFAPGETPMVHYYADIVDAFFERKSSERVAKWFATVGLVISDKDSGVVVAALKPTNVFFTENGEEVTKLYMTNKDTGVAACMSKGKAELHGAPTELSDHPTKMYERDISIAFITDNGERGGKVLARAICVPNKKIFGRSYGDSHRLETALTRLGYKSNGTFEHVEAGVSISRLGGLAFGFRTPYFDILRNNVRVFRDKDGTWGMWMFRDSTGEKKPEVEGREYASNTFTIESQTNYTIVFDKAGGFSVKKSVDMRPTDYHALINANGEAIAYEGPPAFEHLEGALPAKYIGRSSVLAYRTYLTRDVLDTVMTPNKWRAEVYEGGVIIGNEDFIRVSPPGDLRNRAMAQLGASPFASGAEPVSVKCKLLGDTSIFIPKAEVLYDKGKDDKIVPVGTIYGKVDFAVFNGMNIANASLVNVFIRDEYIAVMKRLLGTKVRLPEKVSDVIMNLDPSVGINISAEMPSLNGKAIGERVMAVMQAVPELQAAFATTFAKYEKVATK